MTYKKLKLKIKFLFLHIYPYVTEILSERHHIVQIIHDHLHRNQT